MDERMEKALERFRALSAEEQAEALSLLEMLAPPAPAGDDVRAADPGNNRTGPGLPRPNGSTAP